MPHREAFDVCFINDRDVPRNAERPVASPGEVCVHDDRPWSIRSRIRIVPRRPRRVVCVRQQRFVPFAHPVDAPCVRIEQQFGGIAAQAVMWFPWTVDAESVTLPGAESLEVSMPAEDENNEKFTPSPSKVAPSG